ncbi:permease prefix domain 1-containing protein [Paenibacillus sp. BR2-3]|uniref:permease prefix domain 1-containing protein n=1 Tax=Paenibacillus sp. BR2-3 TaxID=3048494 RepID=UPI003977827F
MTEQPFDAKTMEIVHKYIDRLCNRMNESPKEVEEFREEMSTNLLSSVNDWATRGYSESDALDKALENFGEPSQIETELKALYRIKKVFSGSILKAAIVLFLLGALIVGWFFMWNEMLHYEVAKKTFDIVKQEMGTMEQPVSNEMGEKLEKSIAGSDTNKAVSIDLGMKLLSNVTFMVGITLLFGYWVLFAVWASMNVYYSGHGKSLWVILFLLLNVLGYGLYIFVGKMNKQHRRLHRFA